MSHYGKAVVCPANTATPFAGNAVCHFIASISGTISISYTPESGTPIVLASAIVVTAGQWLNLSFYVYHLGGTITTAGGAAGTLITD